MNDFLRWFADSKIASYLRVVAAIVASQAIADFVKVGQFDFTNWQLWLITALAASLPVGLRYLNPKDELS